MADNDNDNDNVVIPRHTPSNPYNYTAAELAERKKTLKDLAEVYPNLPFAWLEMASRCCRCAQIPVTVKRCDVPTVRTCTR